jgi:hypothetical protein
VTGQKILKINANGNVPRRDKAVTVDIEYDPRYTISPGDWMKSLTDEEMRKAQLIACANAQSKGEARDFLEMMGFVKYESGETRWAKTGEQRIRRQKTPEERVAIAAKMLETKQRNKELRDAEFNRMTLPVEI